MNSKLSTLMLAQLGAYFENTRPGADRFLSWYYGQWHARTEAALLRRGLITANTEQHTRTHEPDGTLSDAGRVCGRWVYRDRRGVEVKGQPDRQSHIVTDAGRIALGMDQHANRTAREGFDRCTCGCKYWEFDRCVDCRTAHDPENPSPGDMDAATVSASEPPQHDQWPATKPGWSQPVIERTYDDTRDGVIAMLSACFTYDLADARLTPDPAVRGVWLVEQPGGGRVIAYLAGYGLPGTFGDLRKSNDAEASDDVAYPAVCRAG